MEQCRAIIISLRQIIGMQTSNLIILLNKSTLALVSPKVIQSIIISASERNNILPTRISKNTEWALS